MRPNLGLPVDISPFCDEMQNCGSSTLHLQTQVDDHDNQLRTMGAILRTWPNSAPLIRNFALRGDGGNILPEMTSHTSGLPARTVVSKFLAALRGRDTLDDHINPPIVALEESTSPGECWEFDGSAGFLAVTLSSRVRISNVMIDSVPPSRISPRSAARAPRGMSLWGLLATSTEDLTASLNASHPITTRLVQDFLVYGQLPRSIQATDKFLHLGEFEYDRLASSPFQSFPISEVIGNIGFEVVVLEVKSNWGSNSTCLYHVGINGEEQ